MAETFKSAVKTAIKSDNLTDKTFHLMLLFVQNNAILVSQCGNVQLRGRGMKPANLCF